MICYNKYCYTDLQLCKKLLIDVDDSKIVLHNAKLLDRNPVIVVKLSLNLRLNKSSVLLRILDHAVVYERQIKILTIIHRF